jgi:hypothetical protein
VSAGKGQEIAPVCLAMCIREKTLFVVNICGLLSYQSAKYKKNV